MCVQIYKYACMHSYVLQMRGMSEPCLTIILKKINAKKGKHTNISWSCVFPILVMYLPHHFFHTYHPPDTHTPHTPCNNQSGAG